MHTSMSDQVGAMVARRATPQLIPFKAWAARHGLPLSSAYVIAKRENLPIVKIGRRSFLTSETDERFVADSEEGRLGRPSGQERHLVRTAKASKKPPQ